MFTSCANQNKFNIEAMADRACDCFNKVNKGTIDDKLSPCLSEPVNENIEEIHKKYSTNEPVDIALQNYMSQVLVIMIHTCDKYYLELDSMYTNMYPEIEYDSVKQQIEKLSDSIDNPSLSDSSKIYILHKKISLQTKSRQFNEAFISVDQMTNQFLNESETYWIRTYLYKSTGKYDLAIKEIDKAINSGNESSILIKELIKRKKNGR